MKQFAGCGSNHAYVYVWESFRNSGKHWMLTTAVAVYSSASDGTPNEFKGATTSSTTPSSCGASRPTP